MSRSMAVRALAFRLGVLFCLAASLPVSAVLAQGNGKPRRSGRVTTPPPTDPPLIPARADELPPGTDHLELYLLLGQSNMKGRGVMPETPLNDPRIINLHLRADEWFLARHPLHLVGDPKTFRKHDNAGVGPGLEFAQTIAKVHPQARIGLVPCAVGGSAISRWTKGNRLYENAVRRAKQALADGPAGKTSLRGALWLQGEADARPGRIELYPEKLHGMIRDLREDVGVPKLPFVACTIGEMRSNPEMQEAMNEILLDLPNHVPHTACVDARDLTTHIGDKVHFDTAAQKEIGRRFADKLLKLMGDH